jgi:hypothetical protein
MESYRRAIDIALDTKKPEPSSGNLVVVPVVSLESKVADRGLALHIEKLYDAVYNNSNQERALEEVFDFLSSDAEGLLRRSRNLQNALNPERQSYHSRAYTAAGIAYLLRGQRSHRKGEWAKKGEPAEEEIMDIFSEVSSADDFTFHEFAEWGYKQSVRNEIYWKRQFEGLRSTYHVGLLREAIDESDHYILEV